MKQLTYEKIVEIARATKTAEPGRDGFILPCAFGRAIEAEVLRISGFDDDGMHEAEKVCAEAYQVVGSLLSDLNKFETDEAERILDNLSAAKLVHKDVLPWPSVEHGSWPDEKPNETVYKSADDLFDSLGIDTTPRATGRPDTMDDTARFAADELPAILKKQAG